MVCVMMAGPTLCLDLVQLIFHYDFDTIVVLLWREQ